MKKILSIIFALLLAFGTYAYAIGVGDDGIDDDGIGGSGIGDAGVGDIEPVVFLPLTADLEDDASGSHTLAAGSFSRASGSTRTNPDTGLLEVLWGDRDQLIDTTTGQNPTDADSWWTKYNASIDSDGGLVAANTNNDSHLIYRGSAIHTANTSYILSAKVKVGNVDWVDLAYQNDAGIPDAYFDLANGVVGTLDAENSSSGISAIDADGYYRCWVVYNIGAVSGANDVRIYAAEADNDKVFVGDSTVPEIYVKEIMLEEIPNEFALGPELVSNGDMETGDPPTGWTAGSGATLDGVADERSGGSGSQSIDVQRDSGSYSAYRAVTLEVDSYYQLDGWVKNIDATNGQIRITTTGWASVHMGGFITSTSWTQSTSIFKATTASCYIVLEVTGSSGQSVRFDDVSVKRIPASVYYNALGPEMVSDGGVESGAPTLGSASMSYYNANGAQSSDQASSGANSFKVTKSNTTTKAGSRFVNNSDMGLTDQIPTQVSVDVYLPSGQTVDGLNLRYRDDGGGGVELDSTNTTDSWITLSGTFVPDFDNNTNDRVLWVQAENDSVSAEYWYIDNFSVKQVSQFIQPSDYVNASTIAAEPRYESDGLGVLNTTVINHIEYSEDFEEWTTSGGCSVTQDQTGPDGIAGSAFSVGDVNADTDLVYYTLSNDILPDSSEFTASVWVKGSGTIRIVVRENGGDNSAYANDANIVLTSAWQRVSISGTKDADGNPTNFQIRNMNGDTVEIFGANLTETGFLAPYIPSHGAQVMIAAEDVSWTMTTPFKNMMGDVADSEFTMVVEWTPSYNQTTIGENEEVISVKNGLSLFYTDTAGNNLTYDGANGSHVDSDYVIGTTYTYALRAFDDGGGDYDIEVGVQDSGTWSWDATPGTYDGSYNPSTDLILGNNNEYPFHIKNLKFFNEALSQSEIETRF